MDKPLRILIVEDSEDDIALLLRALRCGGYQVISESVDTARAMRSALENQDWDVITSDHNMPQFNAPEALALAKELRPDVPFIILSGEINLNLAVSLMREGAEDYIQKHELARLIPAIERELREVDLRREQQRGDAALKVINERLREVMENSLDASYKRNLLTDSYDYFSPVIERISGYSRDEMMAMSIETVLSFVHPEDQTELKRYVIEVLSNGTSSTCQVEYRFKNKEGAYRWMLDRFSIMRDSWGQPVALIGSVSDITERKQAENALHKAKNQYDNLVANIPVGVYNLRSTPEGAPVFEYVSPKVAEMFNLPAEKFLEDPMAGFDPIHPDDIESLLELNREHFKHPQPFEWVGRAVVDGRVKWLNIQSSPEPIENGGVPGEVLWHGIIADISERKRAEEALRASETNLAEAQQIAHIGSWEWDMVLNTVKWSNEMYKVFDIDPSTYDGKPESLLKVIHPEDVEIFTDSMNANRTGGQSPSLEYRVIHQDGTVHNIHANGRVEFNRAGCPIRSVGTVQDITERKKITEALRESEEKFKFLHERAGVGIGYHSLDGKVISYNLLAASMMGGKPQDFFGKTLEELYPPQIAAAYLQRIQKAAVSEDVQEYEDNFELGGEPRWFACTFNRMLDSSNRVIGVQITSSDITRSKRVEETLRASEAKQRSLIANISDVIAILSRDGIIQYKSPNIKKWFGWEPDELIGVNGWDTVHPDDLARVQAEFLILLENDRAEKTIEYRYRCKDGSFRWIHLTAVNLLNDPVIQGILLNYHDITERKQLEEAQRLSDEKFSTAFRISPDSININRLKDGLYIDINEGFTNLTGYTAQDVFGKTSLELNIWANPQDRERLVKGLREHGEVLNLEAPFQCKNGEIKISLMSARVIELNQEKCILSITRDITERMQAEAQIHQLNADLERRVAERTAQLIAANRELESFSYSVSHDLRAPLRSLDGYSTVLMDNYAERLDEPGRHYLARIQANSQHMGQLINDLLNLSRVTARAAFHNQQVDLSQLANSVASDIQAQMPQRNMVFDIATGMIVQGDENLLKIVLENLLGNAAKFSNQRDPATIQVGVLKQEEQTVYFVRDNGAGFDMEYADKLFIPFQRLHNENEFPGTGIGLATVQRIIHRHGGRVWAEGEAGLGATFYFTIG